MASISTDRRNIPEPPPKPVLRATSWDEAPQTPPDGLTAPCWPNPLQITIGAAPTRCGASPVCSSWPIESLAHRRCYCDHGRGDR